MVPGDPLHLRDPKRTGWVLVLAAALLEGASRGDQAAGRGRGRPENAAAFLVPVLYLKSPQWPSHSSLSPAPATWAAGGRRCPRPSLGWASGRRFGFTFRQEKKRKRQSEGRRAHRGSVGHGVSRQRPPLPQPGPRPRPPAAPTPRPPPGLGILLSPGVKVKGSRSSLLHDCGRGQPPPPSELLSESPPP